MKGRSLWKRRSGAGSGEGTVPVLGVFPLSKPLLDLLHPECLVFTANEFSFRDLCFCQEHGPEPRLFTMEARPEKCGEREGMCRRGLLCFSSEIN